MKLTLRPEWRLRPLSSFLGFLDIKTGVTIALLFAVSRLECGLQQRIDTRGDSHSSSTRSLAYTALLLSSRVRADPLRSSASTSTQFWALSL